MKSTYARGREIEYRVAALYRGRGYHTTLTSGSKGCYDVHAFNHAESVFVQCKRSLEHWTLHQAAHIFAALPLLPPGARFELWVWVERCGWTVYVRQEQKGIVCTRDDAAPKPRRCIGCGKIFTPQRIDIAAPRVARRLARRMVRKIIRTEK